MFALWLTTLQFVCDKNEPSATYPDSFAESIPLFDCERLRLKEMDVLQTGFFFDFPHCCLEDTFTSLNPTFWQGGDVTFRFMLNGECHPELVILPPNHNAASGLANRHIGKARIPS
ncbi:hypothetical protein DESA109040_18535 [Deinococcus saxicola]